MRTILNMATAFATILALSGEAAALGNFAPVKPLVHPRVTRPAIMPAPHVNRLTRKPDAPAEEGTGSEDESHTKPDRTADNDSPAARTAPLLPETIVASEAAPEVVRRPRLRAPLPPSRPEGLADAGTRHEPPTDAGGGPGAAPEDGRHIHDRLRDAFPHEAITAMRDLHEWLAGRNAVDRDALGGGSDGGGSLSDWRTRIDHDRRSSEGAIARATRGAFDAHDVQEAAASHDGDDGFRPPRRSSPSLGRPGRYGSGLRRGAPANQDGPSDDGGGMQSERTSCGRNCVKWREHHADGSTTTGVDRWFPASGNTSDDGDPMNGNEGKGVMYTEAETRHPNGSRTRNETWGAFDAEGNYTELSQSETHVGREDENGVVHLPPQTWMNPDTQPADPMYGSGGEALLFECFDPVFPCFRPGVDARDTVSQPGRGGNEEIQPATPSVGERLRAVTQPVPGHTGGTGGGGGGGGHVDPCIRAKCNEPRPG